MNEGLEHFVPAVVGPPPLALVGEADQEPVSRAWTSRFALVWLGFWMANLVPLQLLLPQQLAEIDPTSKVHAFALLNAMSGVVALLSLPVCGALSDRSRSRFGRRRIWVAMGSALFAVGLVATGLQTSLLALTVCWSASMVGLSAVTAGLTAVIADRVPTRQRGMISSAIFGPQALAVVIGIGVVAVLQLTTLEGYVVVAAALVTGCVPFLVCYREVPAEAAQVLSLREVLGSLRIDVRANPDFAWAFHGRLLVNLANSLGTCYLLYFLTDRLRSSDPDLDLLLLTVVYLAAGLVCTYTGGYLSDRWQRRRDFVFVAAAMQAAAGLLLALAPTMSVAYVSSALMGGGFGAYMAVDQALVTQLLPDASSRAKDLGIMNIGTMVPPTVAPLLAGLLVSADGSGYPELFGLVTLIATVGAVMVYRIRSVA